MSEEVTGRLRFTNKRESNAAAAALVFDMRSAIQGRVSLKVWTINSTLYENKEFQIQIQNTFTNAE